jgi:hypothetical protein
MTQAIAQIQELFATIQKSEKHLRVLARNINY